MAPMRAFPVWQKWPKIAKMTPNDLGYPWPMKYGPFIILKSANFMQTAGVETIAYSYWIWKPCYEHKLHRMSLQISILHCLLKLQRYDRYILWYHQNLGMGKSAFSPIEILQVFLFQKFENRQWWKVFHRHLKELPVYEIRLYQRSSLEWKFHWIDNTPARRKKIHTAR